MRKHFRRVWAAALAITSDPDEAEGCAQEAVSSARLARTVLTTRRNETLQERHAGPDHASRS